MLRWKRNDILYITDLEKRKLAPEGRSKLRVQFVRTDGWVDIEYEDGTCDSLMYSLLIDHWDVKPGTQTKLWKTINEKS